MVKRNKVELLAPAGNIEGFYGAIHAGADAVYLGGDKFGARAYADNFTTEELVACIRYAHIWGRRVYLTVNTLVKDKEWDQLYDYILPFYEAGLDGVIIQDLGVFLYLKEHFPGMELHVSTQMTLTGAYGAKYMKDLGACRIVPARELSMEEIKTIKADTGLEIEAFIHGAMCYCYSGQCLFSSMIGGRSGNRGRCAQPCRLPYTVEAGRTSAVKQEQECYPLSLKDMCTIEHIPELIEAGIDSFKIEGRMKKPEYAAGVTAVYRRVIDRYYKNPGNFAVKPGELKELSGLYIRSERQDGYYYKHNGADMVTLKSPAYSGTDEGLLQKIRREYLEKKPVKKIDIYGEFLLGKPAVVTFVCEEVTVTVQGELLQQAQKQPVTRENVEKQLCKLGETSFEAANVMIGMDENVFYPLKSLNELRRKAVQELEDALIQENGLPVCRKIAGRNENKFEDEPENIPGNTSGNNPDRAVRLQKDKDREGKVSEKDLTVNVRTKEQLVAVCRFAEENPDSLRRVYVESDLLIGEQEQHDRGDELHDRGDELHDRGVEQHGCGAEQHGRGFGLHDRDAELYDHDIESRIAYLSQKAEVFAVLPYILRKRDGQYLEAVLGYLNSHLNSVAGCMVRSLEGYAYLKTRGYQGKISSDAGFYIWNQETKRYWQDRLDTFCLPWELNAGEQRGLLAESGAQPEKIMRAEKIIYGHTPMMITANCVVRTTRGCRKHKVSQASLTDRYHKEFPVVTNCVHCMNIIYNSVPFSLHNTMDKWRDVTYQRLDFTVEGEEQTLQVLHYFHELLKYGKRDGLTPPYAEYTTGHEKRGVE